jgi:hypothetical protein
VTSSRYPDYDEGTDEKIVHTPYARAERSLLRNEVIRINF